MNKYALFIFLIWVTSTSSFAQLLPVGFIPMEHNGSFAGMGDEGRLTMNTSHLFTTFTSESQGYGYYASYDKFFKVLSTGIGLTAYSFKYKEAFTFFDSLNTTDPDQQNHFWDDSTNFRQNYKGTHATLSIAPKLSLKGKHTISPSIKFKYGRAHKGLSIDEEEIYDKDLEHINVTAGLSLNTPRYYVGYSVRLFSKDEVNFQIRDSRKMIPTTSRFYSVLEAGYSFYRNESSKFSITPQVAILAVTSNSNNIIVSEFDLNLRFQYGKFLSGHSLMVNIKEDRNIDPLAWAYVGWQVKNLRALVMLGGINRVDLNLRCMIPNRDKKRRPVFW